MKIFVDSRELPLTSGYCDHTGACVHGIMQIITKWPIVVIHMYVRQAFVAGVSSSGERGRSAVGVCVCRLQNWRQSTRDRTADDAMIAAEDAYAERSSSMRDFSFALKCRSCQ